MELRYFSGGASLSLEGSKCSGCGLCVEVCPHAVFSLKDGSAAIADRGRCMECGACARNCPSGALSVKAGVGCAAAIIGGLFNGGEVSCGCGGGDAPAKTGKKNKCC